MPEMRGVGADLFGYRDFDRFDKAVVTMFVQTTGDGGMHTIPTALRDAEVATPARAWFLSFCTSVVLNLIALNLFLAVCCSAYSDAAAQVDEVAQEKQRRPMYASGRLSLHFWRTLEYCIGPLMPCTKSARDDQYMS